MSDKELWVQNPGTMDIHLSDLGVKVPKGKTVNVFSVNPYLTREKVNESLSSGSLSKRLENKRLKKVEGPVSARPAVVDQIKQSGESVQVKKSKSSVVVETSSPELEEGDGEGFGFADYGVSDVGPDVTQTKKGAAVVVEAKQDDGGEEAKSDVIVEPKQTTNNVSKQSVVTMETTSKLASHPMGKVANPTNKPGETQPFVVFKPPQDEEKAKEEVKTPEVKAVADESGMVTTNVGKVAGQRSATLQAELQKLAESMNTTVDKLPQSLVDALEAERAIKLEKTSFDAQAATSTPEGATVMKIKEADEEDTGQ